MKKAQEKNVTVFQWLIPVGLIGLCAIPILAGGIRLTQLSLGVVNSESARYFAAPLPLVLHIVSVTAFGIIGAFQFSPVFRKRKPQWHRVCGRILILTGLLAALTGLWMTQFLPPASYDGKILYLFRLIVGMAMILFIVLGVYFIRRRNFLRHGAWMIRAYALGLGAGTQVFTHIPFFVFPSIQGVTARTIFMGLGWGLNVIVAEWIIRRPDFEMKNIL
jgi:hypothetical protein